MSKHEKLVAGARMTTDADIFEFIQALRADARTFCLATVVRTADLTSAKAGAKAVVTADGEINGHLGGGCVRSAVKRAASEALASGVARMISVRPKDAAGSGAAGVEVHTSGCPSGGTVDVFLEPYLLALRVSVLGETPIAKAIRAHADLMGFDTAEGSAEDPHAVIIASQGAGDLAALREAMTGPAPFVAMVASHRKADFLKARLAEEGIDPARLEDLVSPAGLDLGAIDPHEIAISVLAQLVAWRRHGRYSTGGEASDDLQVAEVQAV
ncbi:MAG: XdhC family protein [Pseudomonadota bacterium]